MAPKEGEVSVVGGGCAAVEETWWQTACGGLSSRLGAVRARGLWADCELVVGAGRTPLAAHRVLLAAASPVLAAMLYGPLAHPDQPIILPDVDHQAAQLLLDYMYTDNIIINTCNEACSVYKAAHYLYIPQVEAVCTAYLVNNLNPENVIKIYEFSKLYDIKEIKEKCLHVMSKKTSAVLQRVERMRAETLVELFALPELAIVSEMELFQAAERWLDFALKENGSDVSSNYAYDTDIDRDDGTGDEGNGTGDADIGTGDAGIGTGNYTSDAGNCTSDAGNCTSDTGIGTGDTDIGKSDARIGTGDGNIGTFDGDIGTGDAGIGTGDAGIGTGAGDIGICDARSAWLPYAFACVSQVSTRVTQVSARVMQALVRVTWALPRVTYNGTNNSGVSMSDKAVSTAEIDVSHEDLTDLVSGDLNNKEVDAKVFVRDAVKQIRFLTLDHVQFVPYDTSALLSDSEKLAILSEKLLPAKSYSNMPDGFSRSSIIRNKANVFTVTMRACEKSHSKSFINQNFSWKLFTSEERLTDKRHVWLRCRLAENETDRIDWFCCAKFQVRVLSQKSGVQMMIRWVGSNLFKPNSDYCGLSLKWDYLRNPDNGYVRDGEVTFEVAVSVIEDSVIPEKSKIPKRAQWKLVY